MVQSPQRGSRPAGGWGDRGRAATPARRPQHTGFAGDGGDMGIRILVVEDEANIADYLVRGLREEGFVVEHAADGVDAWHALRAGTWDLVLLDWWLPGQDGLILLRRFRQHDRRTPILFLTA